MIYRKYDPCHYPVVKFAQFSEFYAAHWNMFCDGVGALQSLHCKKPTEKNAAELKVVFA